MPLQQTSGAASYDAFGGGVAAVPAYIEDVFSTWLYTGNGSTQTITNGIDLAGKGGLVWVKSRSFAQYHALNDTARGAGKVLQSNATDPEFNQGTIGLSAFNSSGFSIGFNDGYNQTNATYTSWTFRKQPKFFDVVTYTGDGTGGRSIAHSLGSVPGMIFLKNITSGQDWFVYHRSLAANNFLKLNTTDATGSIGTSAFPSVTSTAFVPTASNGLFPVNSSGNTYVAYLFAHDAGGFGLTGTDNVISCGSFTTDGSGNATISLGYEPQWVMVKGSSAANDWFMQDTMRNMSLGSGSWLYANTSDAQVSSSAILVPTSTGFASQNGNLNTNTTYIYIAIRRGPMKTPTTGTSVFNVITRTSTGGNATINASLSPVDLVITGDPSGNWGYGPLWFDRLRGRIAMLRSAFTSSQINAPDTLTGFDQQTGYTVGADTSAWGMNSSSYPQVLWNFRRAPGFFDIVCYAGNGSSQSISHSLGAVPELSIFKSRNAGGTNWFVNCPAAGTNNAQFLNSTNSFSQSGATVLGSSAIEIISGFTDLNASGSTYVAYLFASCPGVSKVGAYTGNGSSQTINCGFTGGARFVMIKRTDATGAWWVFDTARGIVASAADPALRWNFWSGETTGVDVIDPNSAGFVVKQELTFGLNVSGGTYIFLAIA
jgi:hypothetical protein